MTEGCPRKTWMDCVKEHVKSSGLCPEDAQSRNTTVITTTIATFHLCITSLFSIQCFNTVGWTTGRASGL